MLGVRYLISGLLSHSRSQTDGTARPTGRPETGALVYEWRLAGPVHSGVHQLSRQIVWHICSIRA